MDDDEWVRALAARLDDQRERLGRDLERIAAGSPPIGWDAAAWSEWTPELRRRLVEIVEGFRAATADRQGALGDARALRRAATLRDGDRDAWIEHPFYGPMPMRAARDEATPPASQACRALLAAMRQAAGRRDVEAQHFDTAARADADLFGAARRRLGALRWTLGFEESTTWADVREWATDSWVLGRLNHKPAQGSEARSNDRRDKRHGPATAAAAMVTVATGRGERPATSG